MRITHSARESALSTDILNFIHKRSNIFIIDCQLRIGYLGYMSLCQRFYMKYRCYIQGLISEISLALKSIMVPLSSKDEVIQFQFV